MLIYQQLLSVHNFFSKLQTSEMSLSIDTSPPTPELLEFAKNDLRETPDVVKAALVELRDLIRTDGTLSYQDDDETLTIFLRPCKWYAKSAFELMKRIADFKKKHEAILKDLTPEAEREAMTEYDVVNVLKNKDQHGRRVLIVNHGEKWDPSKVSATEIFRIFYLIHALAVLEPETQIKGIVVILDYEKLGMKQIKGLSPSFAMLLLSFIQEAIPLRLKEVHIVKQPLLFDVVWNIFKPLLKSKLKSRIFFHGSKMESLHKYLAPSHLPANYGGQLPAIDYSGREWYPVILAHADHIKTFNSYGYK